MLSLSLGPTYPVEVTAAGSVVPSAGGLSSMLLFPSSSIICRLPLVTVVRGGTYCTVVTVEVEVAGCSPAVELGSFPGAMSDGM